MLALKLLLLTQTRDLSLHVLKRHGGLLMAHVRPDF
jgi:hypothetical protein